MMDIKQLKALVMAGESETLEFKKSSAALKGAAETLCAFLNGKGGKVLLGVSDEKKIIGQTVSDHSRQEIANILRKFEPTANIDLEYIDIGDSKQVIILTAHPDSRSIPYAFDGRAYERKDSATNTMPQSKYQQQLLSRNLSPVFWESLPAIGISLDDLDHNEITSTAKDIIRKKRLEPHLLSDDTAEILTRLKLIQSGTITNAAVVLYAKEISAHYFQCIVRMARFRGTEKKDFLDSRHEFGHAFYLLREAEAFINRNTAIASRFEKGQMARIDEPEYPFEAVREALINALVHRDYSSPGGSVTITIYADRLEIISSGLLPTGVTLDELKRAHASHPRNPNIINTFFRRGLIEAMGVGTQEIIKSCEESHMKEPEFYEQAGAFVVRMWSRHYRAVKEPAKDDSLTNRQRKIIEILKEHNKLSPHEILLYLNEDITDRTLRTDLQILRETEYLISEGKGPNTRWFLVK